MRKPLVTAAILTGCLHLSGCEKAGAANEVKIALAASTSQVDAMRTEIVELKQRLAKVELSQQQTAKEPTDQPKAKASPSYSPEQVASVNAVVKLCAAAVRKTAPDDKFYSEFDAYFNVAAGRVLNNTVYMGSRPAVYQFNKCMADNGTPID